MEARDGGDVLKVFHGVEGRMGSVYESNREDNIQRHVLCDGGSSDLADFLES